MSINYPGCGSRLFDTSKTISEDPILGPLNMDSSAVVLIWHHLNREAKDDGDWFLAVKQAYLVKGLNNKVFCADVAEGGREYSVYILDEIMAFWDKFL